eukprot:665254-Alexandrium_andersonii.AAC.1
MDSATACSTRRATAPRSPRALLSCGAENPAQRLRRSRGQLHVAGAWRRQRGRRSPRQLCCGPNEGC